MSINSEHLKYINYFIKKNTVYDIKYGAAKSHKEKKQLLLKMYKKTANKFIRGENTENKTAQQKSRCVVCDSKKSTFLKKKKKQQQQQQQKLSLLNPCIL